MKKISIIIVNYNSLNLVSECLASFKKYTPKTNYELIIVNNDDNKERFRDFSQEYPNVRHVQNSGNWGFSSGCNLGAEIATGDFLLFLNPDTQLNETPAIDTMLSLMEEDENIGICGCRTVTARGIGNEISWANPWLLIRWIRLIHHTLNYNKLRVRFAENKDIWYPEFVGGSCLMIKTSDFKKINGWSSDRFWMYGEDSDICYKMTKKLGKVVALIRNCSIDHVGGGASKIDSESTLRLKIEMVISTHNYIVKNANGISKIIILSMYILKSTLPPFLKLLLSLLFFSKKNIKKYSFNFFSIIRYYADSLKRKTWKSNKLKPNIQQN